jgi:hypothetical protein
MYNSSTSVNSAKGLQNDTGIDIEKPIAILKEMPIASNNHAESGQAAAAPTNHSQTPPPNQTQVIGRPMRSISADLRDGSQMVLTYYVVDSIEVHDFFDRTSEIRGCLVITTFGIKIKMDAFGLSETRSVEKITPHINTAVKLMELLSTNAVTPVSLEGVVDDYVAAF